MEYTTFPTVSSQVNDGGTPEELLEEIRVIIGRGKWHLTLHWVCVIKEKALKKVTENGK